MRLPAPEDKPPSSGPGEPGQNEPPGPRAPAPWHGTICCTWEESGSRCPIGAKGYRGWEARRKNPAGPSTTTDRKVNVKRAPRAAEAGSPARSQTSS